MKIFSFGDLHFHQYHTFSYPVEFGYTVRLQEHINTCKEIAKLIIEKKPDLICCGGDVFHTWSIVDTITLDAVVEGLHYIDEACAKLGKPFHIIVGNHDLLSDNNMSSNSLKPFKYYPNIILHETLCDDTEDKILFIPYVMESSVVQSFLTNVKNKEDYVAIAHLDLLGAKYSETIIDQSGMDSKMFSPLKKVLAHHYHLPQKLNKNIIITGSTQVFSFNEPRSILKRGVVIYDTETDSVERIKLNVPDWIKLDDEMDLKEELNNLSPNNYVKLSLASDFSLSENDISLEDLQHKFLKVEVEFDVERIKKITRVRSSEDIIRDSEEDVINDFIDLQQDYSEKKKEKFKQVGMKILGKVRT